MILLVLLTGACAFASALLLLTPPKRAWVRSRLAGHVPAASLGVSPRKSSKERLDGVYGAVEDRFQHTRPWQRLERLRQRSGVSRRTGELVVLAGASGLVLVAFAVVVGSSPALLPVLFLADLAGFVLVLGAKARRRLSAFDDQLPDLLDLLAASLKSGHSFNQALQAVAADAEPPARGEFERVLAEGRLGKPLEDALRDMNSRIGSKEFEFALTAVTIQQQVGGSLAGLLEMVALTVRQRHQFSRKLSALTASGRISAYVLVALPFVVALFLSAVNSDYMSPLFHTATGRLLVGVALVMIACGWVLLKRVVSFGG